MDITVENTLDQTITQKATQVSPLGGDTSNMHLVNYGVDLLNTLIVDTYINNAAAGVLLGLSLNNPALASDSTATLVGILAMDNSLALAADPSYKNGSGLYLSLVSGDSSALVPYMVYAYRYAASRLAKLASRGATGQALINTATNPLNATTKSHMLFNIYVAKSWNEDNSRLSLTAKLRPNKRLYPYGEKLDSVYQLAFTQKF